MLDKDEQAVQAVAQFILEANERGGGIGRRVLVDRSALERANRTDASL